MKPLEIDEIRRAVHGEFLPAGPPQPQFVRGVSTDSRTLAPGDLFVALVGQQFDGHEFLPQAVSGGALAAVVRRGYAPPGPHAVPPGGLIAVADTAAALADLAAYHRGLCAAKVVAVTGSNGKTTVKRMIGHVLSAGGGPPGSRRLTGTCGPRSYNNAVGVPLTLLAVRPGDDYVVCEVGTNAPGEIAALGRLCRPHVAVITSVHPTHLERLGSVEAVAVEKASLAGELAPDGLVIACGDVPPDRGGRELEHALRSHGRTTIWFGSREDCQVRLTDYRVEAGGWRFQVNGRLWARLRVPGRHNAMNALAAMTVAQRFGLDLGAAGEALADFAGVPMRTETVQAGAVTVINDAYNANPASMVAAADVLAERPAGRRVLVVGEMRELGAQAGALHEQTGRELAARRPDLVVGIGPMGRLIARAAAAEGTPAEVFDSVQDALPALPGLLRGGDVVLIKGSRGAALERLVEPIRSAFAPRAGAPLGRPHTL